LKPPRAGTTHAFVQLSPAQQDEFLAAMEKNEVTGFRRRIPGLSSTASGSSP
jgi:hypothetical protein